MTLQTGILYHKLSSFNVSIYYSSQDKSKIVSKLEQVSTVEFNTIVYTYLKELDKIVTKIIAQNESNLEQNQNQIAQNYHLISKIQNIEHFKLDLDQTASVEDYKNVDFKTDLYLSHLKIQNQDKIGKFSILSQVLNFDQNDGNLSLIICL